MTFNSTIDNWIAEAGTNIIAKPSFQSNEALSFTRGWACGKCFASRFVLEISCLRLSKPY